MTTSTASAATHQPTGASVNIPPRRMDFEFPETMKRYYFDDSPFLSSFLTTLSAVDSLAMARDGFYAEGRFADLFAGLKRAPLALEAALRQVPGVADVTNFGGETTQFQLELDPARLNQYHLSLSQVIEAIRKNNSNAGGSVLVRGDQGFVVRGIGLIRNLEDLGNIVVSEQKGTPVFLRSLGKLRLGALARNGILGKDENPDGVSGILLLLRGQNPSRVLDGIHGRVRALNSGLLPPDTKVVPYLDRTDLVKTTLRTVSSSSTSSTRSPCGSAARFSGSASMPAACASPGRNSVIVVPLPAPLSSVTAPLDCLAKPYTVARPRPVPRPASLVVKKGSKARSLTSSLMPLPVSPTAMAT